MARRRDLHEDSRDPDEPQPPAAGRRARKKGAPPRRVTPPQAPVAPPEGVPPRGTTLPPSFFGARALYLLLRLGTAPQPIRLTFVGASGASDADVERVLVRATWRVERRAPGVFDVELPSDRLEPFLETHHPLFRKVDAPGWLFGEAVHHPNDRAEVAIAVDEPATPERKRDLARLGFHMVGESPGEVRGVILGRHLADLVTASWVGPVEVRKVHPPRG